MNFIINDTVARIYNQGHFANVKQKTYRLTHSELRDVITKETFRLEKLKKLYMMEEVTLGKIMQQNKRGLKESRHHDRQRDLIATLSYSSPIKLIQDSHPHPTKLEISSHWLQYDDNEQQLSLMSLCTSKKRYSKEMQKLNEMQERIRRMEAKVKSNRKEDELEIGSIERRYGFLGTEQKREKLDDKESAVRRKIVYDSSEEKANSRSGMQRKGCRNIQAQVQTIGVNCKTPRAKLRKSSNKFTKSTSLLRPCSLLRPSSLIKLKPKQPRRQSFQCQQLYSEISSRLRLQSCVFKDLKMRNDKNELNWLINRFDKEAKARKDVRMMINQNPTVLKKHDMVVG